MFSYFDEDPREEHAHDEQRQPHEDGVERDVIDERESDVVDAPALEDVPPLALLIRGSSVSAKCAGNGPSYLVRSRRDEGRADGGGQHPNDGAQPVRRHGAHAGTEGERNRHEPVVAHCRQAEHVDEHQSHCKSA